MKTLKKILKKNIDNDIKNLNNETKKLIKILTKLLDLNKSIPIEDKNKEELSCKNKCCSSSEPNKSN